MPLGKLLSTLKALKSENKTRIEKIREEYKASKGDKTRIEDIRKVFKKLQHKFSKSIIKVYKSFFHSSMWKNNNNFRLIQIRLIYNVT